MSGTGVFVAVVGPSGAGKDTLIAAARARLAGDDRFVFVRRIITRPADDSEDHDSVTPAAFAAMRRQGAFALHWSAHGLDYGLPAGIEADVGAGRVVVANLSRAMLDAARRRFARVIVVQVTAPAAVLAARLAARGREDAGAVLTRLQRADIRPVEGPDVVTVVNGGSLEPAVEAMMSALAAAAATGAPQVPS